MSDRPNLEQMTESLRAHGWTVNPDDWNGGYIAVNEGSPVHTCLPEGQQIFRLVDDEASTPPDDYVTYLEIREFRSCPTLDDLRALLEELGQTVE